MWLVRRTRRRFCPAPSVACCRPRTAPLLPLLRATVVFGLRRDAEKTAASTCDDLSSADALTAAEDAATQDQANGGGSQEGSAVIRPPRLHIELALRRSRRDTGPLSFGRLETYGDLSHLGAGLRRVLSQAPSMAINNEEDERSAKRRRTTPAEAAAPTVREVLRPSLHDRRWEAAAAAEEELLLLGAEGEGTVAASVAAAVVEKPKVYAEVDDCPTEWRLLPVDLLWAAAPLTKGFIKDPFARLARRMQAAPEEEEAPGSQRDSDDDHAEPSLIHALTASPVPCVCKQISSWRWRAAGITAYFGDFVGLHGTASGGRAGAQQGAGTHGENGVAGLPPAPTELQASEQQHGKMYRKRRRRFLKSHLEALLRDALRFTGLSDPGTLQPADTAETHPAGTEAPRSPNSPPQTDADEPGSIGVASDACRPEVMAKPVGAIDGPAAANASQNPTKTDNSSQLGASSVACFARQVVLPCARACDRLCNCFYSQAHPLQRHGLGGGKGTEQQSDAADPADGDCSGKGASTDPAEWRTFVGRILAAATRKLAQARDACCCRKCNSMQGQVPSTSDSKVGCTWRSTLWTEYEKVVHSYLTGASGCTASLRLAVALPRGSKKERKKQGDKVPVAAEPLKPWARAEFLRRVADAYESAEWRPTTCETQPASETTGLLPLSGPTETPEAGEDGESRGDDQNNTRTSDKLWSAEEVLHWQFSCSMWCNTGLRLLVAQYITPVIEEMS